MKLRNCFGLAICALALVCFCLLATPVHAAEQGRYTYEVHDGKATITGCTWTNASYLEIPRNIDGYPVVAIGANAFSNRNDLLGVIVSEGVETIDYRAFWYCRNLSWVVLPDSLTTIADEAFAVCSSLSSAEFGDGLKTIGYAAFANCGNLYDAELPEGLESIGMSAFYKCYSLESVWLPNSLKTLGSRAYDSCVNLGEFYIPSTVTSIGANVLYNTPYYYNYNYWYGDVFYMGPYLLQAKKTVSGSCAVMPGTTLIADGAFENCSKLTEAILPDSLRIIGAKAFSCCDGITGIAIPAGVTTIGDQAFYWCDALADVQFAGSVANIGQEVFGRTPYYKNTENWETNAFYVGDCLVSCDASLSGVFQVRPGTTTIADGAMKGLTKLTEITLPDSVTTIGEKAFYECTALKAIHLGKNVSQIGDAAFGQCSGLESITVDSGNTTYRAQNNCLIRGSTLVMGCKGSRIPQDGSVTVIGPFAFEGCDGLTEITIPDRVLTIGEGAFRDCNALTTVHLGDGVQVVGKRAFEECDVLRQIDLGQSVHTIEDFGFAYNHQITSLNFPASLQHLGEEAFSNSTGLVTVRFQEGLLSIGKNCFTFCENLTAVHLPDSLEEIKDGAFYSCEKIASLTLGKGLITIGSSAFDGCKALVTLEIPTNVQTIGRYAFYECTSLRQVDLGNVQKIGDGAFESCTSLTQIHIPASVQQLGKQVFSYCSAMTQMSVSTENPYYHSQDNCIIHTRDRYLAYGCQNSIIPADGSVITLAAYSFAGCSGLKSIVVPNTVIKIHAYTFYDCSRLAYMELPFVGGESDYDNYIGYIFGGGPSQNDLYVPATLKRIVITGGTVVGDSGFSKCSGLQEIILPETITTIGYSAFANCKHLQWVVVPGNLQKPKSADIFSGTPYAMLRISAGQENTISLVKDHDIRHQIGGLITFTDEQNRVIDRVWYPVNREISTPVVPEKPADEHCTYEITWEPVPDRCNGNQTIRLRYVAHWTGETIPGDLTGDGTVTEADVIFLLWHTVSPEGFPAEGKVDFDGDGSTTEADVIYLLWHTVFPEDYPLG